jgi:transposase InsO family protein
MEGLGGLGRADDGTLSRIYRDPVTGYQSAKKFHRRLRDLGYTNTLKQVTTWLARQTTVQVNRTPHQPKKFNTIYADKPGDDFQMDIMVFKKFAERGFQYILVVIDVNSRYLGLCAMKNREAPTYTNCFRQLCEQHFKHWPRLLHCDREFRSHEFTALLGEHNVSPKFSQPEEPNKNAIVERVIRTIRMWLGRWRYDNDSTDWPNHIDALVENYNNTYHSTIKQKPKDIWEGHALNEQKINWIPVKHFVKERVRLWLRASASDPFRKSGENQLSQEIYEVVEKKGFSWVVKNVRTGMIPSYKDGEPKLYKDYELYSVVDPLQGREYDPESKVKHNVIENRVANNLRKEDIFEFESNPYAIPTVQLGVFRRRGFILEPPEVERPVQWRKVFRGREVSTFVPWEIDGFETRPGDYDPIKSGWVRAGPATHEPSPEATDADLLVASYSYGYSPTTEQLFPGVSLLSDAERVDIIKECKRRKLNQQACNRLWESAGRTAVRNRSNEIGEKEKIKE